MGYSRAKNIFLIYIMEYKIILEATLESNLSEEELNKTLVLALHDTESWFSKFDWVDDNLRVVDYQKITIKCICPFCADSLENRLVDIDGTNLIEMKTCLSCQYKTT